MTRGSHPITEHGKVVGFRSRGGRRLDLAKPTITRYSDDELMEALTGKKTPTPPKPEPVEPRRTGVPIPPNGVDWTKLSTELSRRGIEYRAIPEGLRVYFKSSSHPGTYHETTVWGKDAKKFGGTITCNCPGWRFRRSCRHLAEVQRCMM